MFRLIHFHSVRFTAFLLVDFSIPCTIHSGFSSRFTDSETTKLNDEKRTNRKLTNLQPPLAIPHRTVKCQMTKYYIQINCYRPLLPFRRLMKSKILLSGPLKSSWNKEPSCVQWSYAHWLTLTRKKSFTGEGSHSQCHQEMLWMWANHGYCLQTSIL